MKTETVCLVTTSLLISLPFWVGWIPLLVACLPLLYYLAGYRWQWLPILVAVLLRLSVAFELIPFYMWIPEMIYVTTLLLTGGSWVLCSAFPLFQLPRPAGQYGVGTCVSSWYDEKRGRRLPVQIWYPSEEIPTRSPVPFWWPQNHLMSAALCRLFGLPSWVLCHLTRCYSNSYEGLHVINQQLPLIIFCHGFYGFKGDRTYFCEQFASNGYLVLSADHVGDCALGIYPEGSEGDGPNIPFSAFLNPDDDEYEVRCAGLGTRVSDIDFLLERLEGIRQKESLDNVEAVLADSLDLTQIGCFGHSYGSATLVQFLQEGQRVHQVKGVIGLDPWVFPLKPASENGVTLPLMFLSSELWPAGLHPSALRRRKKIIENSTSVSRGFVIRDTKHHNFDDLPFLVHPWIAQYLGFTGGISSDLCFTLLAEYSLSFFDCYVRDIKSSRTFPDTLKNIYLESSGSIPSPKR